MDRADRAGRRRCRCQAIAQRTAPPPAPGRVADRGRARRRRRSVGPLVGRSPADRLAASSPLGVLFVAAAALASARRTPGRRDACARRRPRRRSALVALASLVVLAVSRGDAVLSATTGAGWRFRGVGAEPEHRADAARRSACRSRVWRSLARPAPRCVGSVSRSCSCSPARSSSRARAGAVIAGFGGAHRYCARTRPIGRGRSSPLRAVCARSRSSASRSRGSRARRPSPTTPHRRTSPVRRDARDRRGALVRLEDEIGFPARGRYVPPAKRTLFGASGRAQAWDGALHQGGERPIAGYGFGTEDTRLRRPLLRVRGRASSRTRTSGLFLQLGAAGVALLVALLAASRGRGATRAALSARRRRPGGRRRGVLSQRAPDRRARSPASCRSATSPRRRSGSALLALPRARARDADVHDRMRRPRLLVFNQYYWPGVEATAHLLSELCRGLADEFDITVVTGSLRAGSNHRPRRPRRRRRSSACRRPRSTARASGCARRNYADVPRGLARAGLRGAAAGRRPVHDRSTGDRRRRDARRPPVPGAARRREPGRLSGDRRRAEAARQPVADRRAALRDRAVPPRADRVVAIGDTMRRAARGEGRAARAAAGDPELGRHRDARRRAPRTTSGRGSTTSTTGSSSCTRATSGTRRTSTRSSARRPSSATSTTSRSS